MVRTWAEKEMRNLSRYCPLKSMGKFFINAIGLQVTKIFI
jgi:hypothetical protein